MDAKERQIAILECLLTLQSLQRQEDECRSAKESARVEREIRLCARLIMRHNPQESELRGVITLAVLRHYAHNA